MLRWVCLALALLAPIEGFAASQGGPIPVPLPLFPGNNWWNTDVSSAPVDTNSGNFIAHINFDPVNMVPVIRHVHPDWGGNAGADNCSLYGFPYILVDGSQPLKTVTFDTPGESDGVDHNTQTSYPFYPIPDEAFAQCGWIEDGPAGTVNDFANSDRHMLIVDTTHNWLFELYHVLYTGGAWTAGSGAFFDMNTNNRRTEGWTSADAAGLAMLPGLVRYDEVYGPNEITHAFRFTVRDTNRYVYPASHIAGGASGALPMGARLRLKASTDIITGYPADVQKILRALMKYGIIVADNGSDMYIQGNYDNNWNMDTFLSTSSGLAKLTANDFEVVQQGWAPSINFILTLPAAMGNGDAADATLTAYDASYNVATGYRGTVTFTSTDLSASLPANYTFTAGDNGTHTFPSGFTMHTAGGQTVYATDLADPTFTTSRNVIVGPATPTGLAATATSMTHVDLSWSTSSGATSYEVQRVSASSAYTTIATVTAPTTTYPDTGVTVGNIYVYRVRAMDASARPSPYGTPDSASTIAFTDDPLLSFATAVKAVHVTELQSAINQLRTAAGIGTFTFSNVNGQTIQAAYLQELRTALTAARTSLHLPTVVYTDPTPAGVFVKAIHFQELRNALK